MTYDFVIDAKSFYSLSEPVGFGGRVELIATESTLFVCPRCGKQALWLHRKTYDEGTIIFCANCRLNTDFTPSKEAKFDANLTYKEFTVQYKNNAEKITP